MKNNSAGDSVGLFGYMTYCHTFCNIIDNLNSIIHEVGLCDLIDIGSRLRIWGLQVWFLPQSVSFRNSNILEMSTTTDCV